MIDPLSLLAQWGSIDEKRRMFVVRTLNDDIRMVCPAHLMTKVLVMRRHDIHMINWVHGLDAAEALVKGVALDSNASKIIAVVQRGRRNDCNVCRNIRRGAPCVVRGREQTFPWRLT